MNYHLNNIQRILIILLLCSCSNYKNKEKEPVDYVNPYVGNISHLLVPTYPTIHLPNSMLRISPERGDYTGDVLNGLPLIVTSHRGSSAFNFSPYQGNVKDIKNVINFSYDQEKITPYSYSVFLDEQKIAILFSLSHQSALYQITFTEDKPPYIILNSRDGGFKWEQGAVSGFQLLDNNTRVYLFLIPDIKPDSIYILNKTNLSSGNEVKGKNSCLILKYNKGIKKLNLRYGVSFISIDQAKDNLTREIPDYNITKLIEKGRKIWNEALGKIEVSGGTVNEKTIFYTSLYRTFERPVCISEGGRYYSAFDNSVHKDEGILFYTDDWIWDTYRAHHPLRVLIDSKMEENILHSFVLMADQMKFHWMPTFPEITGDSRRMNSNHGVAVIIDAYRKGLSGFDLEKAYEVCKAGITEKTLAPWSDKPAGKLNEFYKLNGYLPALKVGEKETLPEVNSYERRQPVAVTLGTSYDEWCLAQIAKELGKKDEYKYFLKCSYNYRNLYNPATNFFHPKDCDGKFIEPFNYTYSGGLGARDYYDENNGWIYRWDVQHNIADLIKLMGGNENFVKNLDSMFTIPMGKSKFEFFAQLPDQTGNMGQFSISNEPAMHIPYLYNYAGQPWKTQKRIRSILNDWFRNDLMGNPGDEDGGGMTSFVVFSKMGFYPVTPGSGTYNIGSPVFEKTTIHLANGKTFKIIANNCSEQNKYIQSANLNGKSWNKPWFSHDDIKNGGVLELVMGEKANKSWGSLPSEAPPSAEAIQ